MKEALTSFQRAYNRSKVALDASGPNLDPDGKIGTLTWGAFFDCYEFALRDELGVGKSGLDTLREGLVFVDQKHPALGFSEHHPIDKVGTDGVRSQENRRVELLFFDPGEEPDIAAALANPKTSEIYASGRYARTPLEPRPTGKEARILRVFLLDPSHRRMPLARYTVTVGGHRRTGQADESALLVETRVLPAGDCELEWSEASSDPSKPHRYAATLSLDVMVPGTDPGDVVAADRLRNLGYSGELQEMVFAFQADYELDAAEWFHEPTAREIERVHSSGVEAALDDAPFVAESELTA
jgi:hypothetical protein